MCHMRDPSILHTVQSKSPSRTRALGTVWMDDARSSKRLNPNADRRLPATRVDAHHSVRVAPHPET
ncbi:protein of unknown function [Methylorubrum extorquens DM4]|uniref:Uncharacterized protein n=1 Tax=Methylorubrum extorquens (strain DSM 6343 / CIP 106787 / DM4) TaxID=661410 RepID=C7CE83_METED|nr:protein of unknown function [Methylorubrum extorquens DM4]